MDRDELQAEIRAAASSAAEAETLIDYIREGRATEKYAAGQAAYMDDAVQRSMKKLRGKTPEPAFANAFHRYTTQLELLERELSRIRGEIRDVDALSATRERIEQIRKNLKSANSEDSGRTARSRTSVRV